MNGRGTSGPRATTRFLFWLKEDLTRDKGITRVAGRLARFPYASVDNGAAPSSVFCKDGIVTDKKKEMRNVRGMMVVQTIAQKGTNDCTRY